MVECAVDELSSEASSIYREYRGPNQPILEAPLAGMNPGRAVVDDIENPAWCLLRPLHYGFTFIGGEPDGACLLDAAGVLEALGPVALVEPAAHLRPALLASGSCRVVGRHEFSGRAELAHAARVTAPPGYEVLRINRALFEKCEWREAMVEAYGGVHGYLKEGLGYALVAGGEIVCEAHVAFRGASAAEIGAVTRESHRGRGYAPITVSELIRHVEAAGSTTVWSCDRSNDGSTAVARKLGYARQREYDLVVYRKVT